MQDFPKELGETLWNYSTQEVNAPYAYKAFLYNLMYCLNLQPLEIIDTVSKIKQYIDLNYMHELTITNLSEFFNFERSYLYRLFKKHTGKSVKEYLTAVRLEKARLFLKKGYSVCDTAFLVGYNDQFNFSKAYKKHFGIAPLTQKKR
ncbi:MAG: helix-turn-helix transcriptional regulator [Clostridia bacterium]|nr:helix-turn-helix transcriptional regulator [Clostridia bacterium]